MYNVEERLFDELDQMSKEVTVDKLKEGFQRHRDQTFKQVDRYEKFYMNIDVEPEEMESSAFQGLLDDTNEMNNAIIEDDMINIAYQNAATKVERFEISSYEGPIQLAKMPD